jgi:hypothetical protein
MARRKPETSSELIQSLAQAFESVAPEDLAEAREQLEARGIDPDQVAERLSDIAREALESSPLNWRVRAERERNAALQRLRNIQPEQKSRAELEVAIQQILARTGTASTEYARAYFHKLQGRASDSDLASLLVQLEFLERSNKETE